MNIGVLKALDKGSVHYSFCLKFVWLNSTIDKFLDLYNFRYFKTDGSKTANNGPIQEVRNL